MKIVGSSRLITKKKEEFSTGAHFNEAINREIKSTNRNPKYLDLSNVNTSRNSIMCSSFLSRVVNNDNNFSQKKTLELVHKTFHRKEINSDDEFFMKIEFL